jgi:hypothetical protein
VLKQNISGQKFVINKIQGHTISSGVFGNMLEFLDSTSDIISTKYKVKFFFWGFTLNYSCTLVPRYKGTVFRKFNLVVEKKIKIFELTL